MKKDQNPSIKSLFKKETKSRDKNIYSEKHLPDTKDVSSFNTLERKLNEQIMARQECCEELYQMIQHLDAVKKNKIPADFEKLANKRLLSPNKYQVQQSQDLNLIKAQIAEIHSQKQLQGQEYQMKIKEVGREIKSVKNRFEEIQSIKVNTAHLIEEFKRFKQQVIENNAEIHEQLQSKAQQHVIQSISQKIQNQNMLVKSFSTQLAKIQTNLNTIDGTIKNLNKVMQTLEGIIENQFDKIEQNVNRANKSITETKSRIQQMMYGSPISEQQKIGINSRNLKGNMEVIQKLAYANTRIESLERRMDLIYHEYLAMPIKHKV